MTYAQHARAIAIADDAGERTKRLFERVGNAQAPRGEVLRAYRTARRALAGRMTNRAAVRETLAELRRAVTTTTRQVLSDARDLGLDQAEAMRRVYALPEPRSLAGAAEVDGEAAVLAALNAQIASAQGLALATGDETLILGDDDRQGLLTPGPVTLEIALWVVAVWQAVYHDGLGQARDEFYKQAVAALDQRTTDCCLRVHGQVQPLDKPFNLTGTPRYAEELPAPPFHWYCRTAEALVLREDVDDGLTRAMRASARRRLDDRAKA